MSKSKSNKSKEALNNTQDFNSFKVVFFYCILIIAFPILTFFISKNVVFDGIFTLTSIQSNIYSAISAVVALHIALGLYIYRAYFNDSEKDNQVKQD